MLKDEQSHLHRAPDDTNAQPVTTLTPNPTVITLFSLLPRNYLFLLAFAICLSSVSGGLAPFMTYVVGQVFDAFGAFSAISKPSPTDRSTLLRSVGISSLQLLGLAFGSIILGSATSYVWIWTGEVNTMTVRKHVFRAVMEQDLFWFDSQTVNERGDGPVGSGGLMTKFSKETDDVRMASSLAAGNIVQNLTTSLACLLLAFVRSWALTLMILSAIPVFLVIQSVSQYCATPHIEAEREQIAISATLVERALTSISTVKAFNAELYEKSRSEASFKRLEKTASRLVRVWGFASGLSQFVTMGMFVQAFWFGATLIRSQKATVGDVGAVLWACLLSTTHLNLCIPDFITLTTGQLSMASLLSTAAAYTDSSRSGAGFSTARPGPAPPRCEGELSVQEVSFFYPSNPTHHTLNSVSLFLPAHERTFIVGRSGSGKSTLSQLLLGMHQPSSGSVRLDGHDIHFLDRTFLRSKVMGIGQRGGEGCLILEGQSITANVLMGAEDDGLGTVEVQKACQAALVHEFVKDLPGGYDTVLGGAGGVALSGGQLQRLEIARAVLRNPDVLVLDEVTSALDPTSRLLVFEALMASRAGRTTVVITHDLSQIDGGDFVYLLSEGRVVEQGYRQDLEKGQGEFRRMANSQKQTGGFLPERSDESTPPIISVDIADIDDSEYDFEGPSLRRNHLSTLTFGNWSTVVDAVGDLRRKWSSTALRNSFTASARSHELGERTWASRPFLRPSTSHFSFRQSPAPNPRLTLAQEDEEEVLFAEYKRAIQASGSQAQEIRFDRSRTQHTLRIAQRSTSCPPSLDTTSPPDFFDSPPSSPWRLCVQVYPSIPHKPLLIFGLLISLASGVMTPIFSFLLARLISEVTLGNVDMKKINTFGGIVLSIAAFDGLLFGGRYIVMEWVGSRWITHLRTEAVKRILLQDKPWFDIEHHIPARLVQFIVKDGDDARNLVSLLFPQGLVVVAMLVTGLVWALVRGWELTLVGVGIAPFFAVCMVVQARWVSLCERRNKRAREEVGMVYYKTLLHIKGIRSMSYQGLFQKLFNASSDHALATGVQGAFVEGWTLGLAIGLIYFAEAALFYVASVLLSKGRFTLQQTMEVLSILVFTITIGSQMMAFTETAAKAIQSTHDLHQLSKLPVVSSELTETLTPTLSGPITLSNVSFAYPSRPAINVLRHVNLTIRPGERVAIVGASGCGKSTLAALLHRLYQPTVGRIEWGSWDIARISVSYLRSQIAVVSQSPHLFDASVEENIRYGLSASQASAVDVRAAAESALAHEFISQLANGYAELLGENGGRLSGGQKQRLMLARALVRKAKLLILDECTSSLDGENAMGVVQAISRIVEMDRNRSVVMITHSMEVMRMCDRIIVMNAGEVVEDGALDELLAARGHFASFVNSGEWLS